MEHRIRNLEALAETELRRDALAIAEAGYAAVHTGDAVARKLRLAGDSLTVEGKAYPLAGRRIYFVGVGKCAFAAAAALEQLLGERLAGSIALDVSAPETPLAKTEMLVGTHPIPSEENVEGAKRIMAFLSKRTPQDLVLMLISGGGSALLCLHDAPMTCLDERTLFESLTAKGAPIQDLNMVRKHISLARGGSLATAAYPAEVLSLIVSDVPGDDLEIVASGPTVRDTSTVAEAVAVLTRYGITPPPGIDFIETPKDEKYFARLTNILFLASRDALSAMSAEAQARGYSATIIDDRFSGEAREVGCAITEKLHNTPTKTALLYAGESTVTLPNNHGEGGRNQELALAALAAIRDGELVLPFSSDGCDNTDAAGAIADSATRAHAEEKRLDAATYLASHRSYDFFTSTGDALVTGYTGSNVSDLIIALKH